MKIAAMTTMILMTGALANGQPTVAAAERKVTVCMDASDALVDAWVAARTQMLASRMFNDIGVTIEWRGLRGCPAQSILITLSHGAPESLIRGALAYALPYEGTHICVFYDRIVHRYRKPQLPIVLGHVLVHEITHILQGIQRHSASGVMKAYWDREDCGQMTWKPLRFEPEDVDLIYVGLARRASRDVMALNVVAGR